MRRLFALALVASIGVLAGLAVVRAMPEFDPRWHSLDVSRDASVADRLARSERAPLLFVPDSVSRDQGAPATLVVALPGLGGIGREIASEFAAAAETHRWLLVAPSPSYDPLRGESLESADLRVDDELVALIDTALARSPATVATRIALVGFSRGAQSAHRFALRHPERVAWLASFSAGTYTMPTSQSPYPYGVGFFESWDHGHAFDPVALRAVHVLIGVGALDENPADVVRGWDGVGGTSRVERAARFTRALRELSVPVRFQLYASVRHMFVPAMREDAIALFIGS